MSAILHYSGAIELWGLSFPFFSRGRYVSRLKLPSLDVGALYPTLNVGGSYRYRCLFLKALSTGTINLAISGPFPSGRSEIMEVALGAQSPTTYIPYLNDETQMPSVFGGWNTTLSVNLQQGQTLPLWFRLYIPSTASSTRGSWFSISINNVVVSHIIYTYKENHVVLPLQLWSSDRRSWVLSGLSSSVLSQKPSSGYDPIGWRQTAYSSVLSQYPVTLGFEESVFSDRLVRVVAGAIGEFWRRADAAAGIRQTITEMDGDAAVRLAFPVTVEGDALVSMYSSLRSLRNDALVNFARNLVGLAGDSLIFLGDNYLSVRGDALLHAGYERLLRGDSLTFLAMRLESKLGDAQLLFSSIDDILGLPHGAISYYGFSIIPGLSWVTLNHPFLVAQFHATDLSGNGRLRVLEEVHSDLWRVVGTVGIYPSISQFNINSRSIRLRNDSEEWGLAAWAIIPS